MGWHPCLLADQDRQPSGGADLPDHMPVGYGRDAMKAVADPSAPGDDEAYRGVFDKIVAIVRVLHDCNVFIVFGTDTGGSFAYHREIELYQRAGMTPPEISGRATFDSAKYLGQDQRLGSIEEGKLADFFLVPGDPTKDLKAVKTNRMVVKDATLYYPSGVYPGFGIEPFTSAPPRLRNPPVIDNGSLSPREFDRQRSSAELFVALDCPYASGHAIGIDSEIRSGRPS
jgi:hypothetical protein